MADGYLNILKPPGFTSHDVVARVRRLTGERRVGHTGTLDPEAVGVLPIAIGRATRTVSSASWDAKTYWADITFGIETDTDDAAGQVVSTGSVPPLDSDSIRRCLAAFVGPFEQRPPAYSAVHIEGQRAYRAARQGNRSEPPPRMVRVDAIDVARWDAPLLSLRIQCGSGTYIRSIARDLGRALGTVAHLSGLVRLRVGPFGIADATTLEELERLTADGSWEGALWPLDTAALEVPAIVEGPSRSLDLHYGRRWRASERAARHSNADGPDGVNAAAARVYATTGELLGLVRIDAEGCWQPTLALRATTVESIEHHG